MCLNFRKTSSGVAHLKSFDALAQKVPWESEDTKYEEWQPFSSLKLCLISIAPQTSCEFQYTWMMVCQKDLRFLTFLV